MVVNHINVLAQLGKAILVLWVCAIVQPVTVYAQSQRPEVPFGDKVSERIPFYHRAAPTIATAGPLGRLGIIEAKAVGFKSILNLAVSSAVVGLDDGSMASYVLLGYFNVRVSDRLPTADQVAEINRILNARENEPILMYGADRDQSAAAWALVRAASGIPPEIAVQDGRTAGLRDRLADVRNRLGLAKN
jgi:hypothetical protein